MSGGELYRARVVAKIDGLGEVEGPWVEYGPTAEDGGNGAALESATRLWHALRSRSRMTASVQRRLEDGTWPSDV